MIHAQPPQIAVSAARELGADEDTALNIGMTVDIAVPLGFAAAIGAVRVAAIKAGRIKLIQHESVTGLKPGGHTLANHVGKTDGELLARFEKNKRLVMSSTFKDLNVAENVISRAIYLNRANIKSLLGGGKTVDALPSIILPVRRLGMDSREVAHSALACVE